MSSKKLSYRNRNRLLLVCIFVACFIAYQLPIKQTLELYKENEQFQDQLRAAEKAPVRIRQIEKQLATYKEILKTASNDSLMQEEFVLNEITNVCKKHGVSIVTFLPAESSDHKGYKVKTQTVQLRGTYKQLLQVINTLELHAIVGRIASVRFALEEDPWQRSSRLFSYLYIQTIQRSSNNEKANIP